MNEVAYYPQLARCLEMAIQANLTQPSISVKAQYLPKNGSNLRSFLADYFSLEGVDVSEALKSYGSDVPKLKTDIAVIFDNPSTNKFEVLLVEAKLLGSAGLKELSQLIGYCLVSRAAYGLLINIGGGISNDLAQIISTDVNLSCIERRLNNAPYLTHKIGIMTYSPETNNLHYIPTSAVASLPQLVSEIENQLR